MCLLAGDLRLQRGEGVVRAAIAPVHESEDAKALTPDVRAFAWTWDGTAERCRLSLDPDDVDGRGATLSPGRRKRWQVAAALPTEPDVRLLDEPTNHRDGDAVPPGPSQRRGGRLRPATGSCRRVGGGVLLPEVDVTVYRGDRVHLAGSNGAGKTTLLRAVLAAMEPTGEVVAELPQQIGDPVQEAIRIGCWSPTHPRRAIGSPIRTDDVYLEVPA